MRKAPEATPLHDRPVGSEQLLYPATAWHLVAIRDGFKHTALLADSVMDA